MALVVKDRVKEVTTTVGTSDFTLGGAVLGYQSFSVIGNTNQTYYSCTDPSTGDWEVGIGTYSTTGPTLTRDTVLESSNSGSKVSFAAGSKDIFCTYPAERSVYLDTAGSAVTVLDVGTLGTSTANITTANITSGTVSTTPTSSTDIANKTYVDNLVSSGTSYHTPVKYEVPNTTGNLTALYNNGTGGVGATLTNNGTLAAFAPDGPTASPGDRILVYNQTNAYENGVYTVTTVGSGSVAWVLTRATDANSYGLKDPNALGNGDAFFVTSGNTGAGETYICNTVGTITFGTTAITFAQISAAQVYSAGTGISLSPATTINIANTGVSASTYGSASAVPVFAVNAQGQITSVTNTNIAISGSAVSGNISGSAGSVANALTAGTYLTSGGTFNGSAARTFAVDATSANTASKVVARDASGNFSANIITATLSGAATAATAATNLVGGVLGDIPYQSAAGATAFLTGGTNGYVLKSNGAAAPTWTAATISGVQLGNNLNTLTLGSYLTGTSYNGSAAVTAAVDATSANTASKVVARDASGNFSAGTITASLSGNATSATTATSATSATTATTATNLAGGSAGTVPYQSAAGTTVQLAAGSSGQVLTSNGAAAPSWTTPATVNNGTLTMNVSGTGLSGSQTFTANQSSAATFTVTSNATSANTASTIVARDASGNFSAGTITATLSGNASTATSAGYSTYLITQDIRTLSPSSTAAYRLGFGFTSWANNNTSPYADYLALRSYSDASGGNDNLLMFNKSTIGMRLWQQSFGSATAYSSYADVLMTNNYNSYAPTLTGGGASGTWSINVTGSAGSATTATTATTATNWGSYGAVPAAGTSFGNANTIGRSDGSGYTYFYYINSSTSNSENPTVSQVIVTNGSDNFYRKASIAHLTSSLSGTAPINISGNAATATSATSATSATTATTATNQSGGTVNATSVTTSGPIYRSAAGAGYLNGQYPTYESSATSGAIYSIGGSYVPGTTSLGNMYGIGYGYSGNAGITATGAPGSLWGMYVASGGVSRIFLDSDNGRGFFNGAIYSAGNIVLNAGNYNSYSPTLTGTGASGTWSINVTGSAGSATTATTASNANLLNNLSSTQLFNNMGQNHSTYTDANSFTNFGTQYLQGTTNGPGAGGSQWYMLGMGLGNDYSYSQYAMQFAIPRTPLAGNPYISVRFREGGSWNSWAKIWAGYADTAGSATNITAYTINQSVGTGNSPTFADLYVNNWFRNNTSNTGLYNQSTTQHLSSNTNGYWDMSSTTSVSAIRFYTGGHVTSLRGYVYADSSNQIGFLNSAGSWSWKMDNSGNGTATGSVTAYSDERLKKDWEPVAENFVEKLAAVKTGTYTRTDIGERQAGSSAQDWQKLLPEVVRADNEGILSLAYGNAAVVACVELAKEVMKLRAEVQDLKGKINAQ